jgi:hypothetical protein
MKQLVRESTRPFQGLPELVAHDETLFEREGLLVEWVDAPKGCGDVRRSWGWRAVPR